MRLPDPAHPHTSGLVLGGDLGPLGLVMVAGYLQFMLTVIFALQGIQSSSLPHMYLNAVMTPGLFVLAVGWTTLRFLRRVPAESATGFSLAAFGLAARALAEFSAFLAPPPGRAVWRVGIDPVLVSWVRHLGTVAVVTGSAFVVAASLGPVARSMRRRDTVRPTVWMWIVAAACIGLLAWYLYFLLPRAIHLLQK